MAHRARLRSKFGLLAALCAGLGGCQPSPPETPFIPGLFVAASQPGWQQREGRLWLKNELFSGWQYQLWPTGDTAFAGAFREGKAEGFHRYWYVTRQPQEIRHFQNGWQEGEQRGWHELGTPAFVYRFRNDVYHGSVKEWLPNGQLVQDGNYEAGQESGLQRQWFADGSLKANYVVRNGRNYGFTGVKNCVNVWDSMAVAP